MKTMKLTREIEEIELEGRLDELIEKLKRYPANTPIIDEREHSGIYKILVTESVHLNELKSTNYEKAIQQLNNKIKNFELKNPSLRADRRNMIKNIQDRYFDTEKKAISLLLK